MMTAQHANLTRCRAVGRAFFAGLLTLSLSIFAGCLPAEMTDTERALLITVADVERYGAACLNSEAAESYGAKRNLDGSREVEYEYDWEKDDQGAPAVWLKSEAEINADAEAASEALENRVKAYHLGISVGGGDVSVVEDAGLFPWGEEAYAARVTSGDQVIGNIIVVRQGRTVLSLLTLGLDLGPEQLRSLFEPRMLAVPE